MKGNLAVHLVPGQSLLVEAPVDTGRYSAGIGEYPEIRAIYDGVDENGDPKTLPELKKGFTVADPEVGTLRIPSGEEYKNKLAVIYDHKQPYTNKIYFYGSTGRKALVTIVSVSIHDHSSIVQGGPAYGTYYRDKPPADDSGDT